MEIEIKISSERLGYVDREEVGSMATNNIWSTTEALVTISLRERDANKNRIE